MKKFITYILKLTNLLFALLLLFAALSVLINPAQFWPAAFLGLFYPFILIINILYLLFWIVSGRKYFLISLLAIVLSWSQFKKFVQVNIRRNNKEHHSPKILSYNVRLFNFYNWINIPDARNNIIDYIKDEKPQIICLQEVYTDEKVFPLDTLLHQFKTAPYYHFNRTLSKNSKRNYGVATFSAFPIIKRGQIKFHSSENSCIYTDIKFKSDTVRILNCHLQSTLLKSSHVHIIDSLFTTDNNLSKIRDISFKLRNAYIKRSNQSKLIAAFIEKSPYPVIVCGDFNDTPVSYTYRKIKGKLKDAYKQSGFGNGNTYYGNFPSFRIDYIFHSKSISTKNFKTDKIKWSDHYPIKSNFYLKNKN